MSGRRTLDDEFLRSIARQYTEHVAAGRSPAPAIAATEQVPTPRVHRWIVEARKCGFLESTTQGVPSGRRANDLGPTGGHVAENLKRLRFVQRVTTETLAERVSDLGRPMRANTITKIEKLQRRVDVDDLVALAAAFDVTAAQLLEPPTGCGICHGTPPPGFACTECGTTTTKEQPSV